MQRSKSEKALTIGIDLGGTKIATGLCKGGEILKKVLLPTEANRPADAVLNTVLESCRLAMKDVSPSDIAGIGVGAAGQVDPKTGCVLYAPNLNWSKVPLGEFLGGALKLPVKVTNDVRAATIAEWRYGAGKGLRHFINVFVGTGIGSGLVLNGELLEGATNSTGEIGHICLDPQGPVCGCGKKGCFEAYSSGKGLENYVKHRLREGDASKISELVGNDPDKVTGPIIGQAAKAHDHLALHALKRVGNYLGLALANVHTLINPEIILLGGGVMAMKEFFMDEVWTVMNRHILPVADRGRDLLGFARFENDAVLLGSGALFI